MHPAQADGKLTSLKPMVEHVAMSSVARASKACEACRVRRRKCDQCQPCSTCLRHGTGSSCEYRLKSRPSRILPSAFQAGPSFAPSLVPLSSARHTPLTFLCDEVEGQVLEWVSHIGWTLAVRLPQQSTLTPFLGGILPALPGTRRTRQSAIDSFCTTPLVRSSPILIDADITALWSQCERFWELGFSAPPNPDAEMVVLAAISLGFQVETQLARSDAELGNMMAYRLSLDVLHRFPDVCTELTLTALHVLNLVAIQNGGPTEIHAISMRMADQLRRLESQATGLRSSTMSFLSYQTRYRDTCFSTVYGGKPLFSFMRDAPSAVVPSTGNYSTSDLFVHLTIIENDILRWQQSGTFSHSSAYQGMLQHFEVDLHGWRCEFRAEERIGLSDPMSYYAIIRYHWMCLVLRFPLFHHAIFSPPSQIICCQAAASLLRMYDQLRSLAVFRSTWLETRRISTAGQVLLLCYLAGGLSWREFSPLAEIVADLLGRLKIGCLTAVAAEENWRQLLASSNNESEVPLHQQKVDGPTAEAKGVNGISFDFSIH